MPNFVKRESREITLFYQCKSCLAFLPSTTSKWESHMKTCPSKANNPGQSTDVTPISFRLINFQDSSVVLKKLDELDVSKLCGRRDDKVASVNDANDGQIDSASATQVAKKRGARPKFFITTDKPVVDYPAELDLALKPRKSSLNAQDKLRQICSKSRPDQDMKGKHCVTSLAHDKAAKGIIREPKLSNSKRRTKKISSQYLTDSYVRKFSFTCNLCSGKFLSVDAITSHVKCVHRGNVPVVPCCVCGEEFSQIDAYDRHILSHQTAEEREVKYNLLCPWSDSLLKVSSNPPEESCKYCLLVHFTHHSYITHMQEHLNFKYPLILHCKFESCEQTFDTVRGLISHTKSTHRKQFYGTVTTLGVETRAGITDANIDEVKGRNNHPPLPPGVSGTARKCTAPGPDLKYFKPVKSYTAGSSPPHSDPNIDEVKRRNNHSPLPPGVSGTARKCTAPRPDLKYSKPVRSYTAGSSPPYSADYNKFFRGVHNA